MSIGVRAARVRLLDIRQPFRLEANRLLAPDEWPERATYRFYLPQTEPADHLIVAVPCITQDFQFGLPALSLTELLTVLLISYCILTHHRVQLPVSRLAGQIQYSGVSTCPVDV